MLTRMCFILIAVCMMLLSVQRMLGAGGLVINLKEEVSVRSGNVFLKDVANLQGLDAFWIRKLAEVPLASAPEFGMVKTLSRHQISELVQGAAGPIPEASFAGAAVVQIRLQGRPIEFGEIAPVLRAYLSKTTSWRETEIEVRSIGNLKGIEVPPGEVVLLISSNVSLTGRNRILAPIDVVQAGKTLRCLWVTADVCIHAGILTAMKKIPIGKIIATDDVMKTTAEIPDLRATYARNLEDILGKVSSRSFSPGDPLTREAFTNPFLVKNGETVHLRLERNGIVLTSLVRAEQDGRLGQVIRVRNLDFSAILKAQVTGRAEVKLQ